ncbi:MAG: DNA polymerase subunit beta [Chloroflexota bacterium]|nr:MAG: DNA polymerase subunit beta [Chloroflexota bacterium]
MAEILRRRDEIIRIAAARGASNVRVFGSVAAGRARPESDVDFLVDLDPGRSALDVSELILDLREALARDVDVIVIRRESSTADLVRATATPL